MGAKTNCDNWDPATQIPLVTYVPTNFDEQTTKFVKAYDTKGKVYYLPTDEDPDVPVVVIGSCERIGYENANTIDVKPENNLKSVKYVRTKSFRFPNLNKIEWWGNGGPEIRMGIKTNDGNVDVEKVFYFTRKETKKGKWCYRTENLFTWYYSGLESAGFGITEIDGGSKYRFSFSFTFHGATFGLNYVGQNKDDNLGKDQIYTSNPRMIDCGDTFECRLQ